MGQEIGVVHTGARVFGAILNGVQKAAVNVNQSIAVLGQDVVQDRRNRTLLLAKVKKAWSDGALAKKEQVHARFAGGGGLFHLHKCLMPDEVDCPSDASREITNPGPGTPTLSPAKDILEIFDDLGNSLLLLGEPGAGKMTTLLQLVRGAAARAEQEPEAPIPVLLNLSSWQTKHLEFAEWVASELNAEYQVPKLDARRWLESNYLWLCLYGLDEVALALRDDCVRAINAFLENHGLTGIAVCCHSEHYTEANTRLRVYGGIRLEPLTQQQIDAYFDAAGSKLTGLRGEVGADPSLRKLIERPLWLNVLSLTYEDEPQRKLETATGGATATGRKGTWNAYVQRMLQYKVDKEKPYSDGQTIHWLAWLADGMTKHNQGVFLIEKMQPSWLTSRGEQWAYMLASRLLVGLSGGLVGGLIIGIASRLAEGWTLSEALSRGVVRGLVEGLLGGVIAAATVAVFDMIWILRVNHEELTTVGSRFRRSSVKILLILLTVSILVVSLFGLVFGTSEWLGLSARWWLQEGLTVGLIFGLSAGFLFGFGAKGMRQGLEDDIQTVEVLSWSRQGAVSGAIQGIVFGLIAGPVAGVVARYTAFVSPWIEQGLPPVWVVLATAGISVLFLALIGGIFGGLAGTLPTPKKIAPNQGLRQSLSNALITGPLVGLVIGVLGFAVGYLVGAPSERGLPYACTWGLYGLFFGVLASLWYGGVFAAQHAVLRLILWLKGGIPPPGKLVDFLDYAAQRVFLEKVGGSYRWIHGHLQDYFAALDVPAER